VEICYNLLVIETIIITIGGLNMNKRKILTILMVFALIVGSIMLPSKEALAATTSKLKVNNTILEYNKVIYIDGTSGNDTNGDGSKDKPFKTVVKGFDYLNNNCRQSGAIVIKDGTYDVGGLFKGTLNNLSAKYSGMKISLIAETMGKVQFTNVDEWIVVENSSNSRIKVRLYGIIFKSKIKGFYHLGGDDWTNEFYNCVLTSGYGGWKGIVSTANIKVENSLFIGAYDPYCTAHLSGTAINCASTTQYMDPYNGTKTNCLYKVTIDSDYNITSTGWKNTGIGTNPDGTVANIGVYGGQFAWGSKVEEVNVSAPANLTAIANINAKQVELSWNLVEGATSYNIYKSETSGGPYETPIDSVSGSAISLTDKNVDYGKTYYYVVCSVISGMKSANSNEATATLTEPDKKLKLVLEVKEEKQLSVSEELSDNANMTWASSDTSIAIIDENGKVKALKPGNTLITCTSKDGEYTETINVLIVNLDLQLAVDLTVGDKCRLTVDDLANTASIIWKADDSAIATITNKGKVTAVSEGLTYIISTDIEGKEVGRIYIRVRN